jgi:hypothetical protein
MPPRHHPIHAHPAPPPWGGPPPPPPYGGPPPHFAEFNGYDPPPVSALAAVVGDARAEVLHRVLWTSPTEQAGIADLIVSAFAQVLDRAAVLERRLEHLERLLGAAPPAPTEPPGTAPEEGEG